MRFDPSSPPFIVVSAHRGPAAVPCQHPDFDSAMKEARRLSGRSPDDSFLIFRAVCVVEAPAPVVTKFDVPDDEDIPF